MRTWTIGQRIGIAVGIALVLAGWGIASSAIEQREGWGERGGWYWLNGLEGHIEPAQTTPGHYLHGLGMCVMAFGAALSSFLVFGGSKDTSEGVGG